MTPDSTAHSSAQVVCPPAPLPAAPPLADPPPLVAPPPSAPPSLPCPPRAPEVVPVDVLPVDVAPAAAVPVVAVPFEVPPVEVSPVGAVPVDAAPVDVPVDVAPVEVEPVDDPVGAAPVPAAELWLPDAPVAPAPSLQPRAADSAKTAEKPPKYLVIVTPWERRARSVTRDVGPNRLVLVMALSPSKSKRERSPSSGVCSIGIPNSVGLETGRTSRKST